MGDFHVQLDWRGLAHLSRTLKQAGADMQDLKTAYRKAASAVKPRIAKAAPKRTGRLARSVRAGSSQRSGVVRAGSNKVPYAGPINFGWPGHHIKAQHFMGKGLEASRDEVDDIFRQAIEKALSQVKGAES